MQRFARWHIWLGWLVGFPILMWCITGLVMAARPLEEVRGEHLQQEEPRRSVDPATLVFPDVGEPVTSARLVTQELGPVWVIETADGAVNRYSAENGGLFPPLSEADAREVADKAYAGDGAFAGIAFFPAEDEPLELRRGRSSFRVEYADGTRVYVDDVTGEVLAFRTGWWRTYDFMYGLHIMNLQTRSGAHSLFMVVFSSLAVLGALLGCVLMFRRRKARVKA